jgi:hypothetical protein
MPNSNDYDSNGNRLTPFRSIHKAKRRMYKSIKDHNGYYKLVKISTKGKAS